MPRQVTGINPATGASYAAHIDGSGATNVQTVIQTAWNVCGLIYLPGGEYRIDGPLIGPTLDGAGIIGAASATNFVGGSMANASTVIRANFTNGTAILSHASIQQPTFQNLAITRTGAPTAGSYGLDMGSICDHGYLRNLWLKGHHVGLRLRQVGYGRVEFVRSEANVSHGVEITGQWQTGDILSIMNGGDGFRVTCPPGLGGISLGQYSGLATFNNGGNGLSVFGTQADPIYALRLSNSFFGEDGGHGVVLDTFGRDSHYAHQLTNVAAELEGLSGYAFSAHCPEVSMVNCVANNNAQNGVVSEALWTGIQGGVFNGHPGIGILIFSGAASINGVMCSGNIGLAATNAVNALTYTGNFLSGSVVPTDVGAASGVQAFGNY